MPEVVGVALVEGDRVLAARRSSPPALVGRWELAGGKVEPGEDPAVAAVREVAEELGCDVEVTGWLEGRSLVSTGSTGSTGSTVVGSAGVDGLVLRIATARLTDGDPVPTEHDAVRWLRADQLDEVEWADADVPFLAQVRALLEVL